jgi:hypothetical protein
MVGPQEFEVREHPPSTLRNALTADPREVPELEVQKLKTSMEDPLGGAGGRTSSGHHRSLSGIHEVPELKVREHPPST